MIRSISLVLLGEPMAKQSVKQGKNRSGEKIFYQPEKFAAQTTKYKVQIKKQLPKDFKPFSDFVRVESIVFIHPATKAQLKHKKMGAWLRRGGLIPKATQPDLIDNLNKLPFDAMTGQIYTDDSIVYDVCNLSKYYGLNPRIEITLIGV